MSLLKPDPEVLATLRENQTSLRIRVRIPKDWQEQPVLSSLISNHGVTITIRAALLSANAPDDGWFDLEIQGQSNTIRNAILELSNVGADIWPWPQETSL